ncbi:hemoglobin [Irpex rosettiformis]|uniref:Hemoglobin n=1 Tax=Irpex rosettiformis TaxID=378272 RepID=A0ACB8TUW0_9APHY|nr:hemoglobin [Irpex rosettiformis]
MSTAYDDAVKTLPNPPPLTDHQKELIKATVPVLEQHGTEITKVFYKTMLGENPELRNVFNHSKQQRGDQAEALARAVLAYAANIDNLAPLLPAVERLCNKHASLGIQPLQYTIVGKYLLAAITTVVGADVFKGELYDAWAAAYWHLARLCFGREEELYKGGGWRGWREFVVEKKVKEAEDVVSFYFKPKDGKPLPQYKPGQYISVQKFITELGYNQSRQYSLSASPNPSHLRISVRRDRGLTITDPTTGKITPSQSSQLGWLSNLLHAHLNEGDAVELSAPFGDFFLVEEETGPVVFISAGVGVTPVLPMLHAVLAPVNQQQRKVGWVQVLRSRKAHALHDEIFADISAHKDLIRHAIFYNSPEDDEGADFTGRFEVARVPGEVLYLDDPKAVYYVCGPEGFMRDVGVALKERGVDVGRIRAEVFGQGAVPI